MCPADRPSTNRRLSWDVVRAATALLVMLYHSTFMATHFHPELGTPAVEFPYAVGASTLLIVSGYFAAVCVHRRPALRWWVGRVCRLLPAFWVAVPVTTLLMRIASPAGWWYPSWSDTALNMLMVWPWIPDATPYVDASYWTLPVQLSAFTAVLLVACAGRCRPATPVLLWGALVTEMLLLPIRLHTSHEPFRMFHDGLGWHRIHLFVVGVAIHLVATRRVRRGHGVALVVAGLAAHLTQTRETGTTVGVALLTAAVWAAAVGPDWDRAIPAVLHPFVRWFAGIGYGVYLMHQSLGYVVMGRLHARGVGPWGQVPALITTGVLLGWLLTILVERPIHRRLTTLLTRRPAWLPPG